MRANLTLLLCICIALNFVYSQQPVDCGLPSPPGSDNCDDACVYCDLTANGYTGSTIGYTPDPPSNYCGTIENNQWFAFAAGTTTVEFTINAYNCANGDGVQGAIYGMCSPFGAPIACEGGQNNGENIPIVVTANNLVVGQIYWFMVDGWLGDECDYDVTVTQGNTDPPPLDPPGPIDGPLQACDGETVTYTIPDLPGASYYEWTLPDGTVINGQSTSVDYTFGQGGQICVQANNVCNFSDEICIDLEVIAPDAGIISANPSPTCPGETINISVSSFNTDPSITQSIIIADDNGQIVQIAPPSTTSFTHDECATFQVCSYNYITNDGVVPNVGDNISIINCGVDCCELECINISFEDTEPPVFDNPPGNLTLTCFDLLPVMEDQAWTDNCDGNGVVSGVESGSADLCSGGTIERRWDLTDECGNSVTHSQTITIDPVPPPSFDNPPTDITVTCDNIPTAGQDLTYSNGGTGACLISGTVSPVESGNGDICGGTIIYTWEATDQCGNTISHTQNITIEPAPVPQFINPPGNLTVNCDNIPTGAPDLNYTNNANGSCLISGVVSPQQTGQADICGGTINYTWEFTDICGNTIQHIQTITVTPPPVPQFLNPPSDVTIECTEIPTTGPPDLMYTNNGPTNCLFEGSVPGTQVGSADECGGTFRYLWEYQDPCGNLISHQQNFTVNPAPTPQFLNLPADITVTCDNIPTGAPDLEYTNSSSGSCLIQGFVSPTESGQADICGGTISYNWQFTDQCGNTISHTQNVTVDPAPPVIFLNPPQDENVTCATVPPNPGPLSYTNNGPGSCLIQGSVAPSQSGSYNECGGTITYTWTYTDLCGNTITHVKNVNIQPAPQAAFIGSLPQNITVSCEDVSNSAGPLDYTNNESGICLIEGSVVPQLTGTYDECGGTLANTWTFTDNCGRTIQHQQIITVEPAQIAEFTDLPGPQTLSCGEVPPVPPTLDYTNNASGLCLIQGTVQAIQSGSYTSCGGNITYTWTFTDDCNRTISHSQNITVEPASDPVFSDPPMDLNIACDEEFPAPQNLPYSNGETGNCAIEGQVFPSVLVISPLEIEYTWTFTNPCNGNTITHTQNIVQDPAPDIIAQPDFTIICEGESFDLNTVSITDINNTNPNITWHSGTPASPANQLPSTFVSPLVTTTYYALGSNNFGCSDEVEFQLFVEPPPNAGMDGFGNVCFILGNGVNLFNFLNGAYDPTGYWTDPFGSGVDVSNPFNVSFSGFPPGTYTFNYHVPSNGVCPESISEVVIEYLPEITIDILEIACTDDPDFYEVQINTNGFEVTVNTGNIIDLGGGQITISNIPIDEALSIAAFNPGQFECVVVTPVSPPDCDCPTVDPPVNDGNPTICDGEDIPVLTVTLGPNQTANWYDAPAGGNQLAMGTTSYTPVNVTGPGVYTFYVEAVDLITGCVSSVLTPVQLEVFEIPVANSAAIELCDDDNDGFASFDLTLANDQINNEPGVTFSYYENLVDAENQDDALPSNYQNTQSPTQTIYVVVNSVDNCSAISELDLTVLPLPDIDLVITDETCLGDADGTVTINAPDAVNFSLDSLSWTNQNIIGDLEPGDYTAFVEGANGCISSLSFTIEPGLELILEEFEVSCDNNGTSTDPEDDFYTISFLVTNNQGNAVTYTINDGTNNLGEANYGETTSLTLDANEQSFMFSFIDDDTGCSIEELVGPLTPCSSDCLISLDQLDFTCSDNNTPANPTDDFYTIELNASVLNGSTNNTYNVFINNVLSYNFEYGEMASFTLPADGTSPEITIEDNEFLGCLESQIIGPLVTCSEDCILNAVTSNILCDDMGTGSDPMDDVYFFDLVVSGQNLSSGWQSEDGLYSGDYDVPQQLGPILISNGNFVLTILDNVNQSCALETTVVAPESCSNCEPTVDAGIGGTITCFEEIVQLTGSATDMGVFTWTGPNSFSSNDLEIEVSAPGWYFLEGIFNGGCSDRDSVLVEMDMNQPSVDAGENVMLTCQILEVQLSGSGSGTTTVSYQWLNQGGVRSGNTAEILVTESGTYTLIVTDDSNGCTSMDEVEVIPDANLPVADAGTGAVLTCVDTLVLLDGSNSSSGSSIFYEWQDENGQTVRNGYPTGSGSTGCFYLACDQSK